MILIGAVLALLGAAVVVTVTELIVGLACEEGDPCGVGSSPTLTRALAWVTLAGVIAALFLALRNARSARVAAAVAAGAFVLWIPFFVYVVEG